MASYRKMAAVTAAGLIATSAFAQAQQPPGHKVHHSVSAAALTDNEAKAVVSVRSVLAAYKAAIEKLDATGTTRLFTSDSQIFETGGAEGNYANYLSHHLGPELADFKSFKFSDYRVDVRLLGPSTALATESYKYRIETKKGEVAERLGVATSVLRKEGGKWKIVMMHNSARKPRT